MVGNHRLLVDEGLADSPGLRVGQRHVGASSVGVPGGAHLESPLHQILIGQDQESLGQGYRLGPQPVHPGLQHQVQTGAHQRRRQDGRRAGQEPCRPGGSVGVEVEVERVVAAVPASHRVG